MRVSLGSSLVIAGVSVPLLVAAVVFAQAKPVAAPAPVPVASPAPAASVPLAPLAPAPLAPANAAAAPGPVDAPPADSFNLAAALQGSGPSMTNDQIAERAVKTAPSIAKAEAAGEKARQAAEQAYLAVYPRLDLTARYTRLSEATPLATPVSGTQAIAGSAPVPFTTTFKFPKLMLDQFLFEASVAYPVSQLFFSIMPRYRAAQHAVEVQKLQASAEAQIVALRARETFWNYARARAQLMVARASLEQAKAHRRDVDALVNAGTLARVELMRADAQIAAASVIVARARAAVAVARSALYSVTHLDGTEDITIGEEVEHPLPALTETQDAMVARALEQRSEIKALRTLAGVHQENIDAQKGDKLPKLAVGGSADVADPNQRYSMYTHGVRTNWAAFAQLSWSPNDLLSANKGEDQARADLAQTLSDLESLEDGLKIEVAQAYEDYGASREAMEASVTGIAAAEESYRVRREQFRAGAAVATDVIDAEAELRKARLDMANAAIDMRIARARLDRVTEAK